jgi:hypothetical protein
MKCDSTIWRFPLSCLRSPNTVSSPPSSQVMTHGADFLHGDPEVVLGGVGPWGPSCCIPKSQVFPMVPGVFLENPTALAKAGCYLNHIDSNPAEDSSCLSLCQAILADFNISNFYLDNTLQLGRKKQVKPQWLYSIPPFGPCPMKKH